MHFELFKGHLRSTSSLLPITKLLAGAALFILTPLSAAAAPDACPVGAGGVLQCSGNQSAGIAFTEKSGVHVFNLSQGINPASPLDAISVVNSIPGPPQPINITIDETRLIDKTRLINSVGGRGVYASTINGAIQISILGRIQNPSTVITSKDNTIEAVSDNGSVNIIQAGKLKSTNGNGIVALSNSGFGNGSGMYINNSRTIEAFGTGILADARYGVIIYNEVQVRPPFMPIIKANVGIFAKALLGKIYIVNSGIISTVAAGISTENAGAGSTEIYAHGSITSTAGRAIEIQANGGGPVYVISDSNIQAAAGGISVRSATGTAKTSIYSVGTIKSSAGFGIEVLNDFTATGDVVFAVDGEIKTQLDSIHVESRGNITVDLHSETNLASKAGSAIRINNLTPPPLGVGKVVINSKGKALNQASIHSDVAEAIFANGRSVALNFSNTNISSVVAPAVAIFAQDSVKISLLNSSITADPKDLGSVNAIETVLIGPGSMSITVSGKGHIIDTSGNGIEATVLSGSLTGNISNGSFAPGGGNSSISAGQDVLHLFNGNGITSFGIDQSNISAGRNAINALNLNPTATLIPQQTFYINGAQIDAAEHGILVETVKGTSKVNIIQSVINAGKNGIEATDALDVTMRSRSKIVAKGSGIKVETRGFGPPATFVGLRANIDAGSSISGKTGIELKNVINSDINLHGALTGSLDAIVSSGNAADRINLFNGGQITGNIKLAENPGGLTNNKDALIVHTGGRVDSKSVIDIGGGVFLNNGILSPGGKGVIQTTKITVGKGASGSRGFEHGSGGVLEIDLKKQNISDRIEVKGRWNLTGKVVPNLISLGSTGTFDIVKGDTAELGAKLISVSSTPGLQYGLKFVKAAGGITILQLTAKRVAFGSLTQGFGNNAGIFGKHLDKGVNAPGEHPLFQRYINGLATQPTKSKLQQGLKEGAGEANVAPTATSRAASQAFSGHLMSCPVDSQSMYSAIDEGQCAWVNGITRYVERDGDAGTIELAERASGIAGGFQSKISNNWFVGAALSYEDVRISTDIGASSSGERFHAGAVAKYVNGANKIAFSAYGGAGWFDSIRTVTIPFAATATSSQKVQYFGANLRLSHTFKPEAESPWSITPMVDFATNYAHTNGFAETGAGGLNLTYSDSHNTIFSISPAIEFTNESKLTSGGSLRTYARFGATYTNDNNANFNVTLQNSPATSGSFESFTGFDDITGDVHIGLDFVKEKWFARLQADGKFGATTRAIGANIKIGVSF